VAEPWPQHHGGVSPTTSRVRPSKPSNPFDDTAIAGRYEDWYATEGRPADSLEKQLLGKLLRGFPRARSILEVGCGTGHFTRWFVELGLDAVGADTSEPMLHAARWLGGARYLRGDAGALPMADRSFDLTAMITTLEFVPDPARALAEAVRVARHGVLLGVLNRWSIMTLRYLSGGPIWRAARFLDLASSRSSRETRQARGRGTSCGGRRCGRFPECRICLSRGAASSAWACT
jgi:SAM-dependent methyltransferase